MTTTHTPQPFDVDAYLGPFADHVTAEQREAITDAAEQINTRWTDPDDEDTRTDALNAAVQMILGDASLELAGEHHTRALRRYRAAHAGLTGAIIAAAASEPRETELARRAGVSRATVRKALGKS